MFTVHKSISKLVSKCWVDSVNSDHQMIPSNTVIHYLVGPKWYWINQLKHFMSSRMTRDVYVKGNIQ